MRTSVERESDGLVPRALRFNPSVAHRFAPPCDTAPPIRRPAPPTTTRLGSRASDLSDPPAHHGSTDRIRRHAEICDGSGGAAVRIERRQGS